MQTLWLDPGKLTINSSQSETNEHNYIIKNETTQNEHRISRKCNWHFITPEVCGRFWYYFRIIFFLNLLYKNVFIFLRKVCLKSYFHSVRWEVDVSNRGSRRCCCKYSLTNGEKLKEEGLWQWLVSWFVNVQVHSASSHSESILIVSKFMMLLYFWILTCFPMCNGNSSERVIMYFSHLLKCLSKSGVFEHIPSNVPPTCVFALKHIVGKAFLFHSGESEGRCSGSTHLQAAKTSLSQGSYHKTEWCTCSSVAVIQACSM